MAEANKKAATKKPATKRKPATRKAPAKRKKSVVRSNVRSVENKAVAVERKVRRTARQAEQQLDAVEEAAEKLGDRAADVARNALLATLGFYAKAYEQAREQYESLQEGLESRRKDAFVTYADLVKRGEKVEAKAKNAVEDIDLSNLTDRKALEAKLEEARERFAELKNSLGSKKAA